jgi:dipeptidase E
VTDRHIVAIGGAAFEPRSAPLLEHILGLAGEDRPRVAFIPTASGDSSAYVEGFYAAFDPGRAERSHLPLFTRTHRELGAYLLEQDVLFVGGGNTVNMLAVWRAHGVDRIAREAWEAGIVLCGTSAGANCWFEACVTDSFGPDLVPLEDGLGFLAGSFCPHYDTEAQRQPTYRRLVADGFPPGYAADDGVALHFVGTDLAAAVTGPPGGRAVRVERVDGTVVETPLPTELLSSTRAPRGAPPSGR